MNKSNGDVEKATKYPSSEFRGKVQARDKLLKIIGVVHLKRWV